MVHPFWPLFDLEVRTPLLALCYPDDALKFQGRGIGKEMRAATLHLGFAGFGAEEATTTAFADNARSLGVTRSLGYEPNGRG